MVYTSSLALCAAILAPLAAAQVKIMPMGDSTTAVTCWRGELVKTLNSAGLQGKYHFVGTQGGSSGGLFSMGSTCAGIGSEGSHEGYPAYKATYSGSGPQGSFLGLGGEWDDPKANLLPTVLAKDKPDVVTILLGINDLSFSGKPASIVAAFGKFVDQIRAQKASMRIVVAKIPSSTSVDATALNTAIAAWAPTKSTAASPITVVDCNTGFIPKSDTRDGTHFNDAGDKKVAACFAPEITRIIKELSGGAAGAAAAPAAAVAAPVAAAPVAAAPVAAAPAVAAPAAAAPAASGFSFSSLLKSLLSGSR